MIRSILPVLLAASLVACGDSGPTTTPPADAQRTADALTGDAAGAAGDNAVCKLFTPGELAAYAGEALEPGRNAAMGTGCQWVAKDGEGDVMIQIVPKSYHRNPTLADGYARLADLGEQGNVTPDMGGWVAATIIGEESILTSVAGQSATAASAEALLRETIKRRGG